MRRDLGLHDQPGAACLTTPCIGPSGRVELLRPQEVVDFIRERLPTLPLPEIASELFDKCIAPDPRASQGEPPGGVTDPLRPLIQDRRTHAYAQVLAAIT